VRGPEHRLRDPPIGVARNEHHRGAPSADSLGRLTSSNSPARRSAKTLNVHDVDLMPAARPGYYTHDLREVSTVYDSPSVASLIDRYRCMPVPAGMSLPMITFSFRPSSGSTFPFVAASVSTRVVS